MAVYDLEEQEQLAELKTWWTQYGNLITAIVVALALSVLGWQGWNWWQRSQSSEASALYMSLQRAAAQQDAKRTRELAGVLIDKYSSTAYAGMAALLSGKTQAETGDLKTAKAQLQWAADNARDEALRDLARLRLATVLLDEKAYDEAMKWLAAEPAAASFAPRFGEVRGDVFAALGKTAEAKAAYAAALAKLAEKVGAGGTAAQQVAPYKAVLQDKLDALGTGTVGGAK
ncbi:MAG: tetratricopeptide repeat protein [Gammaproteobacteria bacterium]|nr:tetratricopeptide repeat protein [Gammaproteobacteria bacterium]MBU1646287.1 tetratricopeptide repeat protein [Gammaproteobacteria bacterium]MBU1970830.1 tetratricopeptide repeat protein [Gammaproteobacteria bacterium]